MGRAAAPLDSSGEAEIWGRYAAHRDTRPLLQAIGVHSSPKHTRLNQQSADATHNAIFPPP